MPSSAFQHPPNTNLPPQSGRTLALTALLSKTADEKAQQIKHIQTQLHGIEPHMLAKWWGIDTTLIEPNHLPGHPEKPILKHHLDIPQRPLHTQEGLAALLHAVAHIEFNAINLALDAIWRFPAMPADYYAQWLQIAAEESYHFSLLEGILHKLGFCYGSFSAHQGLWNMVERTKHCIVARMALVPRTLEARGLDATPPMQNKLRKAGTPLALEAVSVLDIILRDEVGHVQIGNHWYAYLCEQRGLEPVSHYRQLTRQYKAPKLRPPLNKEARIRAGFSEQELAYLCGELKLENTPH